MLNSIIQFFTKYAKDVSIGRMIGHAIILVMVASWLGFVTIFVVNFKTISGMYMEYWDNQNIQITKALTVSSKINELIMEQRIRLGVDRLYISKFHDSKRDLQKIHFFFFSRVSESTGIGTSNQITRAQNLPLSVFPGMVTALSNGQCYHLDLSNPDTPVENGSYFSELGVKATTICPIYNIDGSLIGIIGAEDVINSIVADNKEHVDNTLNTLSGVLGNILTEG